MVQGSLGDTDPYFGSHILLQSLAGTYLCGGSSAVGTHMSLPPGCC